MKTTSNIVPDINSTMAYMQSLDTRFDAIHKAKEEEMIANLKMAATKTDNIKYAFTLDRLTIELLRAFFGYVVLVGLVGDAGLIRAGVYNEDEINEIKRSSKTASKRPFGMVLFELERIIM